MLRHTPDASHIRVYKQRQNVPITSNATESERTSKQKQFKDEFSFDKHTTDHTNGVT